MRQMPTWPALRAATTAGLGLVLLLAACGTDSTSAASGGASATPACQSSNPQKGPDNFTDTVALTTKSDGLQFGDFKVGTGASPATGQTVTVQYTGWLTNGTKFDSSRDRGQPFTFPIGQGQVIAGWDEGVATMRVGGKRRLVIPGALAYGANPPPGSPITANATLVFDVELLATC